MEKEWAIFLAFVALVAMLVFSFSRPRTISAHLPHPLNVTLDYINPFNNRTLHVTGWSTGNILAGEVDLFVGDGDYGAMNIGDSIQLAHLDGIGQLGDLNVTNIFILRHFEDVAKNNISFLFTSQNLVRLAIPVAGADFATYNPRSQMIGGDLGQQNDDDMIRCSKQGYTFIDCTTDVTGADLGVQDDLEVRGNIFGSVPYGEMWFHNDSATGFPTVIVSSDTWTNVSGFDQTTDANQTLNEFNFSGGNVLSPNHDGVYHAGYSVSFQKLTAAGVVQEFKTILFVNGESMNSTETHRTIQRADEVGVVGGTAIFTLLAGDIVYLRVQAVANTVDFGIHAASVNLFRIGN